MMNDTDTLLNVSELCVGKAGSGDLVHNVSFTIQRGQVLSLLGETGSGKTLTALSIIRLLSPGLSLTGSIEMAGQNLLKLSEKEMRLWRGRRIAMIFQEPQTALNPVLSVGRQLDEVLKLTPGLSAAGRWDRALELLEAVRLPEPHRHILEYPHQLSGGMKQRVMIALALAGDPDLLIADEPTTALDVTVQSQILDVLLDLQKKRNMALLLITHDLGVAARMADSIVVMKEGSMVETAAAPAFFKAPQHEYSRELFGNLPERMDPRPSPPDNNGQPILEVRNLSVHFPIKRGILRRTHGYVRAVNDVTFNLATGRTLAVVGESGSGKTTMGRAILRLIDPTSGSVHFEGTDLATLRGQELRRRRAGFQVVFQDPYSSLNPRMTIADIVEEGMRAQNIGEHRAERQERVDELLRHVSLDPSRKNDYPHEFSGGQRQRICLARALAVKPRLLICDEPTSSLDISVQAQILRLLVRLQQELQLAYLFITHDLSVVRYLADDIMVMHEGQVVEQGVAADVIKDPAEEETRRLLEAVLSVPE